mmetsp:Transcript_102124/g.288413  ORF Transcript_102124/g.288413 Transcript_102124/m.288413 type:complete len:200 (-) Transcript_102124:151-750(-)
MLPLVVLGAHLAEPRLHEIHPVQHLCQPIVLTQQIAGGVLLPVAYPQENGFRVAGVRDVRGASTTNSHVDDERHDRRNYRAGALHAEAHHKKDYRGNTPAARAEVRWQRRPKQVLQRHFRPLFPEEYLRLLPQPAVHVPINSDDQVQKDECENDRGGKSKKLRKRLPSSLQFSEMVPGVAVPGEIQLEQVQNYASFKVF